MAMIVQHNISAINTQRNLTITNRHLSKSLEKLSSGYRINTGQDGPADLIISEQLRAQNAGLERAVRNTQEAINVIGIAEGALNEMNAILKKMRQLALHAANNGITSPEQVAADQGEVDSGIQTIDRIANTTKYSDQFLLNGAKGIVFDRDTLVKGTQQNALVDVGLSRLNQIFKREDFNINMAFNGTQGAAADNYTLRGDGQANVENEARKAYFEINPQNGANEVATTGQLTAAQEFILTGNKGSRAFKFDSGATMGQIASAITNVADSTGVDATLVFNDIQLHDELTNVTAAALGNTTTTTAGTRAAGDIVVFNNDQSQGITAVAGTLETVVDRSGATVTAGAIVGFNTDGQGRIWVRWTTDTSYNLYKDASLSAESLVGHGSTGTASVSDNLSGLQGLTLSATNAGGTVQYLAVTGIEGLGRELTAAGAATTTAGVTYSGGLFDGVTGDGELDDSATFLSGVELARNTDLEGQIHLKVVIEDANNSLGTVYAYRSASMQSSDLVAKSIEGVDLSAGTVLLNESRNSDNTAGTGLGIALAVDTDLANNASDGDERTGKISFDNLGVRISSAEYGADQFVRIQQQTGKLWQYYAQADNASATVVDAGTSGTTVEQYGNNASLTVNGTQVESNGLTLNVSTQDVQAELQLNGGSTGSTTIAQVGYTDGSVFTKIKDLTDTTWDAGDTTNGQLAFTPDGVSGNIYYGSFVTNAGHNTTEMLDNFTSGMQFQLGEGAGDQERTVYSIESMSVVNLGMTEFTDVFDEGTAVIENRRLSLDDVLGGGVASLANDPIKALSIIDSAINNVSELRARLGATQSNLLQTNANSLRVAIENIQKTESAIRDADMAAETTAFTKNQILVSAGTSMLAQANVMAQNVLQLLG